MKRLLSVLLFGCLVLSFAMPSAAQDDMAQANKEIFRNALAELSAGNPEAYNNLVPEEFLMNQGSPILEPMSRDDVVGYNAMLLGAMPDLQMVADVIVAQGDWVAAQVTSTGTFTGAVDFFGMQSEPTGEIVTWTEMSFMKFNESGQVVEVWVMSDPAILFGQLGFFPPAEGGDVTETPLELPAGYQTLSADELAATYTSGMEDRNTALVNDQIARGLGSDTTGDYTDPYIAWNNGNPFLVTVENQIEDQAFTQMIATALPDYTITTNVIVAEGDWVATLATVSGTFSQDVDIFGMSATATNETVTWQLGIVDRFNADGLIVEEWVETDASPLFIGLGLMPPME